MTKFLYYLNVYCILYYVIVIILTSAWDEPLQPLNVGGALINVFAALILLPDLLKKK